MKTLQSHQLQALDLDMRIDEVIAVRMDGYYDLIIYTDDDDEADYFGILVTQRNKKRQFKTLDAVDSFLLGIDIYGFQVMSEADFNHLMSEVNFNDEYIEPNN